MNDPYNNQCPERANKLTENSLHNIVATILAGAASAIAGAIAGWFLSERSTQRKEFKTACAELTESFLDDLVKFERSTLEIEGTTVYKILIQSYPRHCAAAYRFRSILKGQKLIDFNTVWHQYQYPDNNTDNGHFGYYIMPDNNGNVKMIDPKFVSHKIESLLTYANP